MFANRDDAAVQLAERFRGRPLHDPVVVGMVPGGVTPALVIAQALDAALDVAFARRLRSPYEPEQHLGAVSEDGAIHLIPGIVDELDFTRKHLKEEGRRRQEELAHQRNTIREAIAPESLTDRSVILTDDGVATGATLSATAALLRTHGPRELIVAVPVATRRRIAELRQRCDDFVCLLEPLDVWHVSRFYRDYTDLSDEDVIKAVRTYRTTRPHHAVF